MHASMSRSVVISLVISEKEVFMICIVVQKQLQVNANSYKSTRADGHMINLQVDASWQVYVSICFVNSL